MKIKGKLNIKKLMKEMSRDRMKVPPARIESSRKLDKLDKIIRKEARHDDGI